MSLQTVLLFTSARLWPLCAIFRATLFAIRHANRIQRSANDVIANTGQVFNATTSNKDNRVFLQVVTDSGDVGRNLNPIGQSHTSHLAQCRIRFLWSLRIDTCANATLLGRTLERRASRFVLDLLAAFANKLINSRHCFSSYPLAHLARKKARTCLFPEPVRQSAQAAALLKL